jgi:hypothetical protein
MERDVVDVIKTLFQDSKRLPSLSFNKNIFKKLNLPEPNESLKTSTNEYLWLIKPSELNRGRGIKMFSSLEEMCQIVK